MKSSKISLFPGTSQEKNCKNRGIFKKINGKTEEFGELSIMDTEEFEFSAMGKSWFYFVPDALHYARDTKIHRP